MCQYTLPVCLNRYLVGIERDRVQALRAQLREMAQQHVNEIGRETEVTFYVTQQRRVWFTPRWTAR